MQANILAAKNRLSLLIRAAHIGDKKIAAPSKSYL